MNKYIVILLLVFSESVCAEVTTLSCKIGKSNNIMYLIIDDSNNTVIKTYVDDPFVSKGKVVITKSHYVTSFPMSERRYEIEIIIDRYSGNLSWEHGEPLFSQSSPENIRQRGKCTKIANEPNM